MPGIYVIGFIAGNYVVSLLGINLTFVFLLLCRGAQTLPWQSSRDEVHQNVTQTLHVVSAALLDTEMCVNAGVSRRTRKVLVFSVRYVGVRPCVPVLLCEAEVNYVDQISLLSETPVNKACLTKSCKSTLRTTEPYIKKLSGLMSRWMKFLE